MLIIILLIFGTIFHNNFVCSLNRFSHEYEIFEVENLWKNYSHSFDEDLDTQIFEIFINESVSSHKFHPFWKSTGLCPPDPHQDAYKYLLSSDMEQNLFHIGSLPNTGIEQVRIHWLLELIQIRVFSNSTVDYNFTHLDKLLFTLWKNNLHPGFELMGNPSNFFSDFENKTQVYLWKNLVYAIANHYIDLFGIEYVIKWNFETWNEPDHHDFDNLNFTKQGFLNYYDACSEGLKSADKRLCFGGPGGSCRIPSVGHSPLCWALLNHCAHGRNYFTGEIGVRLDFISFHKKGNASTFLILDEEIQTMDYIRNNYPELSHVPFFNDEADPLKNWSLPQWWRADVNYAAMVVKTILKHIQLFFLNKSGTLDVGDFKLLSNDNAFLSYFPNQFMQRTLLARFQVNNTCPKYVEFVKKPVYAAFVLLSKLCTEILPTVVMNGEMNEYIKSEFGVLATVCESRNEINIMLYNTDDAQAKKSTANVHVIFNSSKTFASDIRWTLFELNNIETNPYFVWQKFGMPVFPTPKQFYFMKGHEEPYLRGPYNLKSSDVWKFNFFIPNPGVTLIHICKEQKPLKQVTKLRFLQSWNFTLQISWTDEHNRCVLTYNVEKSSFKLGPYHQINLRNITTPSYWHSCFDSSRNCTIRGFYRVFAVNYWGTQGPYSEPFYHKFT